MQLSTWRWAVELEKAFLCLGGANQHDVRIKRIVGQRGHGHRLIFSARQPHDGLFKLAAVSSGFDPYDAAKSSVEVGGRDLCQTYNGRTGGKEKISLISPEKLNEELGSIQLIDVRTPEEFAEGHLENAKNMNYYDDDFKQQLSVLDKNQKVYVYCKKGGRSSSAAELLSEMGFTEIYDLEGGMDNWKDKGLKTVK